MRGDDGLLGRAELERAFGALGDRLVRRGVVVDLFVVGGAAMALAYDAQRVTRDVDAFAARVRDEEDLQALARIIGVSRLDAALEICASFFPDEPLPARSRAMLEDLFPHRQPERASKQG